MKLAPFALTVACLLAGCGSTTPTAPPPASPAGSPAAQVDPSAPANVVEAPPSSGEPAPSASAAPQPTPTADPEAVRTAAAAWFQAAGAANSQAFEAHPWNDKHLDRYERDLAEIWGRYLAALKQLQVPRDTASDLRDLIRKVTRVQAAHREASAAVAAPSMDDWWRARRHIRDRTSKMDDAASRVRADLGLPAGCNLECPDPASYSYP